MTLHSTCLPSGRRVTLYLPPGYAELPTQRHPVLVLQDGQNLFEADRAYVKGEHWRVGEAVDALIQAGRIPPLVVAGIEHAGADRIFEFTPTRGAGGEGGGAADYARLVVGEALPFLREQYAVTEDPALTGLGGSSLGGLVTLFIAASYPGVFSKLLVMSPSVWWDNRHVLRVLAARRGTMEGRIFRPGLTKAAVLAGSEDPALHRARIATTRIWVDVGLREGESTIRDARRLRRVLARLEPGVELHYLEEAVGDHSEQSWARRLPEALMFLFGNSSD
jgi:enterochelin esterase-like enzyme